MSQTLQNDLSTKTLSIIGLLKSLTLVMSNKSTVHTPIDFTDKQNYWYIAFRGALIQCSVWVSLRYFFLPDQVFGETRPNQIRYCVRILIHVIVKPHKSHIEVLKLWTDKKLNALVTDRYRSILRNVGIRSESFLKNGIAPPLSMRSQWNDWNSSTKFQ